MDATAIKAHAPMINSEVEREDESSMRYISFVCGLAMVGAELGTAEVVGAIVGDCYE